MGAFETLIQAMIEMDLIQLFFPWLLVAAVTYGALDKFEVFEEDAVNGAVSLAIAFISMAGIYIFAPAGLLANFGAALAFGVFAILGFMIMLAIAGVDIDEAMDKEEAPALAAGIIVIISIIGVLAYQLDIRQILGPLTESGSVAQEVLMPIVTLIFLLLVIDAVTNSGGDGE